MAIEQTVEIPPSRRLVIDVPPEVPAGPVILTFTPVSGKQERTEARDMLLFRTGFMEGQVSVPPDFDTMGQEEIAALFGETP
jgi:hypothetical protein